MESKRTANHFDKAYRGAQSYSFSISLHRSLYPRGTSPPTPLKGVWVEIWTWWWRGKFLPLQGIERRWEIPEKQFVRMSTGVKWPKVQVF